jgi:hypothetical protein
MSRKSLVPGLLGLLVVAVCAVVAAGVVAGVRWLLDRAWPDTGPHAQLLFALVAPFGVVLFGLLVETADGWAVRLLS